MSLKENVPDGYKDQPACQQAGNQNSKNPSSQKKILARQPGCRHPTHPDPQRSQRGRTTHGRSSTSKHSRPGAFLRHHERRKRSRNR